MAGRRRRRGRPSFRPILIAVSAVFLAGWWFYAGRDDATVTDPVPVLARRPALRTNRPLRAESPPPPADVSEKGRREEPQDRNSGVTEDATRRCRQLIAAGKQALAGNDLVAARSHFSEALALSALEREAMFLRAELTRIGNETVFSPRIFSDDPYAVGYVIQPGDSLVRIAGKNHVSAELLARINNIPNMNLIRAGQRIKVIKGPFRAQVDKKTFSLEVYLGNVFVARFRVGLGIDDSTPAGEWRVSTKLVNPTYYPPRGGQIVAGDDPTNPLGERWIGLEGVGGEAVGMLRYGIHGTIEPDSIGKHASMGCIRMFNEDVEMLYSYLVEKHSTVTIQ